MEAKEQRHDVFQAVADPTRRELLRLLRSGEELPLKGITPHFSMTRAAVSKHLHILSDAGLLHERRVGRETRYRMNPDPLLELRRWLAFFERYWDNKLGMLKMIAETEHGAAVGKPDRPAAPVGPGSADRTGQGMD
ncbi:MULTISPECIES: metalloregulator ArsR/SmtB family transcription factor [unclassified Paenibacillus]|uniref:ArsR/SmtB family transcription factor n=1 Tax=unclassified Paenibacillus TaxID=185978 RepID=UPI000955EB70|nr:MULTISPECIES: metalloregulator ArsR/SmtB family transcription factor [unclassified Paenibacillus]ASS68397.1 helix-turn-helix transcriptional regulator [Paenibacillus sp. RUD330]SIR31952.1 DNA-binding transcriptional regulator, ArsR family [Paenibacillus sp. RU4X]SIR43272.1 DNA-binding transcriptional regulator, ArsR family [Paenibacillus sp. RU4T]